MSRRVCALQRCVCAAALVEQLQQCGGQGVVPWSSTAAARESRVQKVSKSGGGTDKSGSDRRSRGGGNDTAGIASITCTSSSSRSWDADCVGESGRGGVAATSPALAPAAPLALASSVWAAQRLAGCTSDNVGAVTGPFWAEGGEHVRGRWWRPHPALATSAHSVQFRGWPRVYVVECARTLEYPRARGLAATEAAGAGGPLSAGVRALSCSARASGSDVRVGTIIERKGRMFEVTKTQHTQQGRGGATIQVELRDVQSGLKSSEKLRTLESVEVVFVDAKPFSFLYREGETAHLMDGESFEQLSLPMSMFGDASGLAREGMQVTVRFFNGEPLAAALPARVTARVVEAEPYFKGQAASPMYKKVVLEGGVLVQAPPFVVVGDEVVVQTTDLSYVTRSKGHDGE